MSHVLPGILLCLFCVAGALCQAGEPVPPPEVRPTVERGLAYLQTAGKRWADTHQCASCHHVPLMIWAMNAARQAGYQVDDELLDWSTRWTTAAENPGKLLAPAVVEPNREGGTLGLAYLRLAVAPAAKEDAPLPAECQQLTERLLGRQTAAGAWHSIGRPPLFGSDEEMTLVARLALAADSPAAPPSTPAPDDRQRKLAQADAWLLAHESSIPQSLHLRLLLSAQGVQCSRRSEQELLQAILASQRAEGAFAQAADLEGDAFATGQALVAMAAAGLPRHHDAFRRACEWLVATQRDNGSWPMKSRPVPAPGPGADGQGSRDLEPITYAGSAWAVLGLVAARAR